MHHAVLRRSLPDFDALVLLGSRRFDEAASDFHTRVASNVQGIAFP